MDTHRIKITAPLVPHGGSVELDGVTLNGVKSVSLTMGVDEMTTVTITMLADVECVGEALLNSKESQ